VFLLLVCLAQVALGQFLFRLRLLLLAQQVAVLAVPLSKLQKSKLEQFSTSLLVLAAHSSLEQLPALLMEIPAALPLSPVVCST
jgi:hypothetical protein